jgi:hypothetical protein
MSAMLHPEDIAHTPPIHQMNPKDPRKSNSPYVSIPELWGVRARLLHHWCQRPHGAAAFISLPHPIAITKFIDDAQEIDVDAVAHKKLGHKIYHPWNTFDINSSEISAPSF